MKTGSHTAVAAALLFLAVGSASAAVTVTFTNPDKYSDMPQFDSDKTRVLAGLETHFKTLAAGLPPGQDLKVEVLDVDLAGRIDPMRTTQDLRILRGQADWPKMKLHYSLEEQGKVVKSGTDNISDMTYMDHLNRYNGSDALRYEKKMIDDWFKNTVSARQVMGVPTSNTAAVK
jgi:hypothetical protein